MSEPIQAIRCDHDGLKMAEIKDGHLILRAKHHGETHIKIVPLGEVVGVTAIKINEPVTEKCKTKEMQKGLFPFAPYSC